MAQENRSVPYLTAPVAAALDLRGQQYKLVNINATGVRLCIGDAGSGRPFVLMSTPNSGQSASLNLPPNVTKVWAGGTVNIGEPVMATTSAVCIATSLSWGALGASSLQPLIFGIAQSTVASGSLVDVALI